ncbi:hypothetical protein CES85_2498 [Ochrobactrum quorumnocens]|uniref:Uncharacterized protein n=1 Tax=Ochrobactrum quorumnocens TaxID=271865 RepID=A0A248UHW8_9HYPH|nr:hypothetical protein CES85_2498 [[Ochrobactrum] quorumnocens]
MDYWLRKFLTGRDKLMAMLYEPASSGKSDIVISGSGKARDVRKPINGVPLLPDSLGIAARPRLLGGKCRAL